MSKRAQPSGVILSDKDISVAKGMLLRGDRQHDIAAWFGINAGRIAEIANGSRGSWIIPAHPDDLPPAGPYPAAKFAHSAIAAIDQAKAALAQAEAMIRDNP